jgi:hypothetical protein
MAEEDWDGWVMLHQALGESAEYPGRSTFYNLT